MARRVLVTAHRGSSGAAPENTLAAIRRAIDDGADYCELDVQELRDGTIALFHDGDLQRIANDPRQVCDLTLEEARELDVGRWFGEEFRGERIPTLAEAMELVRGKMKLHLELKYHGAERDFERRVIEVIRENDFAQQCVVASLNDDALLRIHEMAPELSLGQVVGNARVKIRARILDFLSMSTRWVKPGRIQRNREAGLGTWVWTVNDEDRMFKMIEYGVDGIITDEPARLRAILGGSAS